MAGHILRDSFKPVDYKEGERSNLVLSEFHHIVGTTSSYARPKALALGRVAFVMGVLRL